MQESHGKGPASHPDPESCVDVISGNGIDGVLVSAGSGDLNSATLSGSTLTVKGSFTAPIANVAYVLEFFANPSGGMDENWVTLGARKSAPVFAVKGSRKSPSVREGPLENPQKCYLKPACFEPCPSGDAEGKIYLGSLTVTPTSTGTQNFTFTVTTTVTGTEPLITATLTDNTADTSAFSSGVTTT